MDVLDGYEKDTIRVGVKVTRLSFKAITKGVLFLLKGLKNKVFPAEVIGKTTIKQLMKKGDKLIGQDIKNPDLKLLSKALKSYNIGFSVIQHQGTENYTLFFKAKDQAQLIAGLDAYLAKAVSRNTPEQKQPNIDKSEPNRENPNISRNNTEQNRSDKSVDKHNYTKKDAIFYDSVNQVYRPVFREAEALEHDRNIPKDVSFAAAKQKEPKAKQPIPRSISKELEEAKAVSKAMQQTREAQKQLTRQRTKECAR